MNKPDAVERHTVEGHARLVLQDTGGDGRVSAGTVADKEAQLCSSLSIQSFAIQTSQLRTLLKMQQVRTSLWGSVTLGFSLLGSKRSQVLQKPSSITAFGEALFLYSVRLNLESTDDNGWRMPRVGGKEGSRDLPDSRLVMLKAVMIRTDASPVPAGSTRKGQNQTLALETAN